MRIHPATLVILILLLGGAGALGFMAVTTQEDTGPARADGPAAVAVQTAPVRTGTIRDIRTLSGTLEASSRFIVAAEAAGLLSSITVDIADPMDRGEVIATIDDRRFVQAIEQAKAELAVREAERSRAETRLQVARAEFDRETALRDEGVSSESEYDAALANFETAKAERAVADARVAQARAALEIANIRLEETRVTADWTGNATTAVVGERYQEAGNTVGIGDPIVAGVVLDPLRAVVSVTERDYTRLAVGQPVTLNADAMPRRSFEGRIARISPVFNEASRQARVEITVDNPDLALKPGMFVRVRIVLAERESHTIVPLQAVRSREDRPVVFALTESGDAVREIPVDVGITQGGEAEILEPRITTPVVTLGHQLLDDGSPVRIANEGPLVDAPAEEGAADAETSGETGGGTP